MRRHDSSKENAMKITGAATVFPVTNLDASLAYFLNVLGFKEDFRFGQYAGIKHGECCLHLSQQGNPNTGQPGTGAIYIFCDEVDGYYADITARGAVTDAPPESYPYGLRDFITRDPDGNQLTFGAPTKGEQPASETTS
jgi:catechol 2,3-dioxygenase-like lactoylglutathione lyase family enzyme